MLALWIFIVVVAIGGVYALGFLHGATPPKVKPIPFTCDACKIDSDERIGYTELSLDVEAEEGDGSLIVLPLSLKVCRNCVRA